MHSHFTFLIQTAAPRWFRFPDGKRNKGTTIFFDMLRPIVFKNCEICRFRQIAVLFASKFLLTRDLTKSSSTNIFLDVHLYF